MWEQEEVEKGMKMKKVSMQAQPARVISKTRVPRMSKRRKTKIRRVPVERCKKKKKKRGERCKKGERCTILALSLCHAWPLPSHVRTTALLGHDTPTRHGRMELMSDGWNIWGSWEN